MLKQLYAVTMMGMKSLPQRKGNSSVIVIGIAGVVAVLTAILAMATGFQHTLAGAARDDRFVALRAGANTEMNSTLTREEAALFEGLAGIARLKEGAPKLSNEVLTIINLPKRDTGEVNSITLRGVGPAMQAVRPEFQIVEGRMFRPAVRELVIGRSAGQQFAGASVGSVIHVRSADWTVVGVFETAGTVHESELFADADTVAASTRATGYTSIRGVLADPAALATLKNALAQEGRLKVDVHTESDYMRGQASKVSELIDSVGVAVGFIMAIGATFGALNSMYAGIAARRKEIATLRAIGFNPSAVLAAVMFEALVLALLGGAIGSALSWVIFNGYQVSTLGGSFTQVMFKLRVDGGLIATGIVWACLVGLIGGFFPSLRAARQPIVDGFRTN